MLGRSIILASLFTLAACAEPVDDDATTDTADIEAAPVVEQSPAAPEPIGATAELEADENVPSLAEVQVALATAAEAVSGATGADLKKRMRTGTVVTTDDRNWELRFTQSAKRMSLSRAVGVDMESATIAGQGYRFRVPYGTLLCVSDKPLHGEIKLPGQANAFYEEAIAAHLQIGVNACKRLREEGPRLHSRKLRAFNEPPFR